MSLVRFSVLFFQKGWKLLTEPFESLPKAEDQRRAVITSAISLFAFIGFLLDRLAAGSTPLFGLAFLAVSYFVARTRWFKIAAMILFVALSVPSFLFALNTSNPTAIEMVSAFAWLVLPLLLSSLLYSIQTTVIFSAVNFLLLLALPLLRSELGFNIVGVAVCFYVLISLIIITVMVQRNQIENDRQRELIESRNQLAKEAAQREIFAEQAQRRAGQFVTLNEVGRVISSLNGLENVLDLILEQVRRNIPLDLFFVALYDESSSTVSFPLLFDNGQKYQEKPLPLSDLPRIHRTIQTGQPLLLNRTEDEIKFTPGEVRLGDRTRLTASLMMSPLTIGVRTAGVISAQSYTLDLYTDEHLMLLSAIAQQVAIAIENARLLEETKQTAGYLSILNELGRVVAELRDLPSLLEVIYEQVKKYLKVDAFYVGLFHLKNDTVSYPIIYDEGVRYQSNVEPLEPDSYLLDVIHGEPARLILRAEQDLEQISIETGMIGNRSKKSASLMIAPMKAGEQIIGVISTQSYTFDAYTKDDLNLLVGIANQVAVAIENARLYASAQQEIRERLRVEMELQRERDFAVQIMNTLGQGVAVSRLDSVYEYINPAYASMLGYTPEEMIGEVSDNFVHPDDRERLNKETERRFVGEATTYEIQLLHKDGHIVHALITGVPRYANGKIIGAIAAVTDLTERKRTEIDRENLLKEMEKKNAELERFTYTVSHDLKSPLVTIGGFLGFLESDIQHGHYDKIPRTANRIREATKKMQRLLDELLELSRIGRLVNPPQSVPFGELVAETLELVDGQLRKSQVQVRVDAEFPTVHVDRVRMIEVIQNLVVNAAKFMGDQKSPCIEIGSRIEDGKTVFFVKDNGMGIALEYHERIFGLFNKLDSQTDGTGIGLALVKRIIEVHGGRIWVQSEPGKGATFFFTLGESTKQEKL